jgi:hypothetical protein
MGIEAMKPVSENRSASLQILNNFSLTHLVNGNLIVTISQQENRFLLQALCWKDQKGCGYIITPPHLPLTFRLGRLGRLAEESESA